MSDLYLISYLKINQKLIKVEGEEIRPKDNRNNYVVIAAIYKWKGLSKIDIIKEETIILANMNM